MGLLAWYLGYVDVAYKELVGVTGYGLAFLHARMQPLTRGPEADETKTMTVALPCHACVLLS